MEGGENLNACLDEAEVIFSRKICSSPDLKENLPTEPFTFGHRNLFRKLRCQSIFIVSLSVHSWRNDGIRVMG